MRACWLAAIATYFLALPGCASQPLNDTFPEHVSWDGTSSAGSGAWSGDAVARDAPVQPNAPAGLAAPPATTSPYFAALHNAVGAVGGALKIEPKVAPAYDPVSLSADPGPVGGDLYYQAARVFESKGNLHSAIAHYEKALSQSPEDPLILVSCARLYDRQGEFPIADSLYQRAIRAAPDNPTAFNDLGTCLLRRGAAQAAVPPLSRAVELQPLNKLYRNNLATALVELGRADKAFQHLMAVHGEAVAHYNLGSLLWKAQKPEEARQQFLAALAVDPSLTPARKVLAQFSGGPSDGALGRPSAGPSHDPSRSAGGYPVPTLPSATVPSSAIRTLPPI